MGARFRGFRVVGLARRGFRGLSEAGKAHQWSEGVGQGRWSDAHDDQSALAERFQLALGARALEEERPGGDPGVWAPAKAPIG
jgi:hypothetical protein